MKLLVCFKTQIKKYICNCDLQYFVSVDVYALSEGTSVAEGATFDITVTRADSGTAVTLTVATSGVATSGSDYVLSASTVEMAVGESVAVVTVTVIDDDVSVRTSLPVIPLTHCLSYTGGKSAVSR